MARGRIAETLAVFGWEVAAEIATWVPGDGANALANIEDLQDQVFRGIGRNVLNLQKMEWMLKFIASSTGKVGSTTDSAEPIKNLERSIKKRRKTIERRPMGQLVKNLSNTLRSCEADQGETAGSDVGFGIEVSFAFEDETSQMNLARP